MIKFKRKSILALVMAFSMTLSFAGCDKKEKSTTEAVTEISTEDSSTDEIITEATDSDTTGYNELPTIEDDPSSPEAIEEQKKFDEYLQESFEESVVNDSITLHYTLAHPENFGITPPEATLGETGVSEEEIAADLAETKEEREELLTFNYDYLTYDQRFTYDILLDELENNITFYDNVYYYEPFAYTSGLQTNLPITMAEYKFYDQQDVEDYLVLVESIREYYNDYLGFERVKSEKGLFMTTNCANEVIRQCEEFTADPEHNLLIETFNTRVSEVEGLTEEQIESYKQRNYDAVMNVVIPAYEDIIATFKELKTTGKNQLGLAHHENGKEYYKYLLRSKVGTDKTPEEVIEALDAKIEDRISAIQEVALQDYEGTMAYFEEDYEKLYGDLDQKETVRLFEELCDDKFPEIPAIDFSVTPVHKSLEEIVSPAFYMTPPLDLYEVNYIYINEGSTSGASLWSTLAHEGVPGHMYQFVYFLSNDPVPLRSLLNFTGYNEGWATYVEMMSFDYFDGYAHDCYADLERINNELNILVSSRVEIGVNYEGWTLEETQDYLTKSGFNPEAAQDIMNYVIAEPANYQMYCFGWLEFEALKEYAQTELGDKFDEKEFHKTVLDAGPCQFYLLKNQVDRYIATAK